MTTRVSFIHQIDAVAIGLIKYADVERHLLSASDKVYYDIIAFSRHRKMLAKDARKKAKWLNQIDMSSVLRAKP